jgi:hypothetical protein
MLKEKQLFKRTHNFVSINREDLNVRKADPSIQTQDVSELSVAGQVMVQPLENRETEKVDVRNFVKLEGEKVINKTYRAE